MREGKRETKLGQRKRGGGSRRLDLFFLLLLNRQQRDSQILHRLGTLMTADLLHPPRSSAQRSAGIEAEKVNKPSTLYVCDSAA